MEWLRSVHFYRKVPADLTEASASGGALSLLSTCLMLFLAASRFVQYLDTTSISTIKMDESLEKKIQINFNVTLHHLPCRYASLDIADVMGTHLQNVSSNVVKRRVNAHGLPVGLDIVKPRSIVHGERRAASADAVPDVSPLLDHTTLPAEIKKRRFVMVNFYAPWCPWCQRLAPIWEEAYSNIMKEHPDMEVLLAKVDCTTATGKDLCRQHHVHAFPTIRIHRRGQIVSHENYVGDRTHEAFEKFVRESMHDKDHDAAASAGHSEMGIIGEGCNVLGVVLVNRVPGNFHFSAHSKAHTFQPGMLNMSHHVDHMTFGRPLGEAMRRIMPAELTAQHNVLADSDHVARGHNTTLEHYLKVIHTTHTFKPTISTARTIDTYQYTANSNNYDDEGGLPAAVFSYDMSPMQVVVEQSGQPLAAFLTQLCAIIGGVFTVTGLVDGLWYHSYAALSRRLRPGAKVLSER